MFGDMDELCQLLKPIISAPWREEGGGVKGLNQTKVWRGEVVPLGEGDSMYVQMISSNA